MTKSEAAFRLSAEILFEESAPIYFWTFTFEDVYHHWEYPGAWRRFVRDIADLYAGALRGLRVIEPHVEHGLHYHALLNERVYVGLVRRIGKRYGIGRVQVERANRGSIDYLAGYLSKEFGRQRPLHVGGARWGGVGGFAPVRVRDVEVQSPQMEAIKVAQSYLECRQLPWELVSVIRGPVVHDRERLLFALEHYRNKRSIEWFVAPGWRWEGERGDRAMRARWGR